MFFLNENGKDGEFKIIINDIPNIFQKDHLNFVFI